jgi:GABA permease
MRNPIRSEADAFHGALALSGLIVASGAVAAVVDPVAGGALAVGGVIGALAWEFASTDPDRRRPFSDAAAEGRRVGALTMRRGIPVVANRTLQGDELAEILRRCAPDAELRVVAPILVSRTHYLASDVDRELAEAQERLTAALAWAQSEGLHASGKVGDPQVALGAIEDELRSFAADEVVICTYPPGLSHWLETGIVERLREELDVPVTHVVVHDDRAQVAAERPLPQD